MKGITSNHCGFCDADLQGSEIPKESRKHYGDKTHFSRRIGIEYPGRYDGVSEWKCPDCGVCVDRFSGREVAA